MAYVNMSSAAIAGIARALDDYQDLLNRKQEQLVNAFDNLISSGAWNDQNTQAFATTHMARLNEEFAAIHRVIQNDFHPALANLYQRLKEYEEQENW